MRSYGQTALLLGLMTALFMVTGYVLGGSAGMIGAVLTALVMNLYSFFRSDQAVLSMHGAQVVDAQSGGQLFQIVQELAVRANMPMPTVTIMHTPQPNAFATGRNPANATVAATTGLLDMLSAEEVAGVMAHELAHIQNRDTLTMTIAAAMGGAISMLAHRAMRFRAMSRRGAAAPSAWASVMIAAIVAPLTATLVKLAISRSREYQADRVGALMCGDPRWLMSALTKIDGGVRQIRNPTAEAYQASAPLFIVNPLAAFPGSHLFGGQLFATHPSMESRLAELQRLARDMNLPVLDHPTDVHTSRRIDRSDAALNDVLFPSRGQHS